MQMIHVILAFCTLQHSNDRWHDTWRMEKDLATKGKNQENKAKGSEQEKAKGRKKKEKGKKKKRVSAEKERKRRKKEKLRRETREPGENLGESFRPNKRE